MQRSLGLKSASSSPNPTRLTSGASDQRLETSSTAIAAATRRHPCVGPVSEITSPHVLGQLRDYRNFIEAAGNRELVAAAYGHAAHVLCELRKLADGLGSRYPLAPEIVAAANSELLVRPNARLLIFDHDPKDHAWRDKHAVKLGGANIDMHTSVKGQRLVWGKRV